MLSKLIIVSAVLAVVLGAAIEKEVKILKQEQEVKSDGYHYSYETDDGTKGEQTGELKTVEKDVSVGVSHGSHSYTGDDGKNYQISYIADEKGYQPQGEHLPVGPTIPPLIQRALEYAIAHPYVEEEKPKKH